MEKSDKNIYNIDFHSLFKNPQKTIKTNFIVKIKELNSEAEQISLNVQSIGNDGIYYKGLCFIKGEVFPIPKINDLVTISEVHFKLDDDFKPRFFIKISKTKDINIILLDDINKTFDFTLNNIESELMNIFKIKNLLKTGIFLILEDTNEGYILKCFEDNEKYILSKSFSVFNDTLKKNDIIYIYKYYLNNYDIKLIAFSLVEQLNEENLFILLENNEEFKKGAFLGKIIEINPSHKNLNEVILVNNEKKLFKKTIGPDLDVKLGQLYLLSHYNINGVKNNIYIISETNKSFVYLSSQDIYFSTKIKLNNLSVIQFHFLDFNKIKEKNELNNLYNAIKINEVKVDIVSDEMNIVIDIKKLKNYESYPISIELIHKTKKENMNVTFYFNLLHGFINKINAFINTCQKVPYFYEYIYYYFDDQIYQANKIIKFGKISKYISVYDIFDSKNRIRFNILNIPFQNECEENILKNSNSLMISEIFSEKNIIPKRVGIFSIEEINKNILKLKSNNAFDNYYDDFGFIYDYLCNGIFDDKEDFIAKCTKLYSLKIKPNENLQFKKISCFEDEITLSQFKTRFGIIVAYYLNIPNNFSHIQRVFSMIYKYRNNVSLMQFLRVFMYLIKKSALELNAYRMCIISELSEFSPYLVAYNFNVQEIKELDESCRLFMIYLQLDSYILSNHFINNNKSYSLTIEPLFIIQKHLIQTYEGFFLIEEWNNDRFAQRITDERITTINIAKIFEFSNITKKEHFEEIRDIKTLKNHAFSISMVLRHENNSHHKKKQKNIYISSPIYYFDKSEIKQIIYLKNNKIQGKNGRLIEAYIDKDREVILSLQTDIIYGELLNINLFKQKDFALLKEKINEIRKNRNKFDINPNEIKFDNEINTSVFDIKEEEKEYYDYMYKVLKIKGVISISDEEYTDELIKDIIEAAKNNDTYNQLPDIFIYFDKRMNKEEQ